MEEKQLADEVT